MARRWRPSPVSSRRCPPPDEAGFSLVEVLAALAIASLALVMSMQLLVQSARVDGRVARETAARDLARRLLAERVEGQGDQGALFWAVTVSPLAPGLVQRQVAVGWPGGPGLTLIRVEQAP